MNCSTHIAMTKDVLVALGWPGDKNLVARQAAFPDEVEAVAVERFGFHVIGKNLASLCHFDDGKTNGYCWKRDRSVPRIDLSSVKVIPHPENWGVELKHEQDEPLTMLVKALTNHATIQADEITYPCSHTMATWAFAVMADRVKAAAAGDHQAQMLVEDSCGWVFHFVQDAGVPHHQMRVLLDGHAAFEGDVDEQYKRMVGTGEVADLVETLVRADNAPASLTVRELVERAARSSASSPRRMCWRRWFWRRGWNQAVRACVVRNLTNSVIAGKLMQRTIWGEV